MRNSVFGGSGRDEPRMARIGADDSRLSFYPRHQRNPRFFHLFSIVIATLAVVSTWTLLNRPRARRVQACWPGGALSAMVIASLPWVSSFFSVSFSADRP